MSEINKEVLGAGLMQHIKAYIDDKIESRIVDYGYTDTTETDSSTKDTTPIGQVFFVDPFEANKSPLSLSLPEAFQSISPTLAASADRDVVVMAVSASSWDVFYARLLTASMLRAEFLETATRVQERFAFNVPPDADYEIESVIIPAQSSSGGLSHWFSQHDQVYSSVLVLTYPTGKIPETFL